MSALQCAATGALRSRVAKRRCLRLGTAALLTAARSLSGGSVVVGGKSFPTDAMTNVTPAILDRTGRGLLHQPDHPLFMIKTHIEGYFRETRGADFDFHDDVHPVVTVEQNFDSLLIPHDHVSRARNDNYYINQSTLLRAHTSAHQIEFISRGRDFLLSGDVYRRDEIDRSHYPVFHQMEGVRLWRGERTGAAVGAETPLAQACHSEADARCVASDLKETLDGLAQHLFGPVETRWVDAYFPFTHPSYELEVFFDGDWLEVLGCGIVKQPILEAAGAHGQIGWAFGLGLERLAMACFGIPDIRLFWSTDERFRSQFHRSMDLASLQFQPFSKYPPCMRDIAFWVPDSFADNSFSDLLRTVAGDLIEHVELIDAFEHPKTRRQSKCFRITYRAMDRNLTNGEVNNLQEAVRQEVVKELDVELR